MLSNLEIIGSKKIPTTAKIVKRNFFNSIISKLDQLVVLLFINYIAG